MHSISPVKNVVASGINMEFRLPDDGAPTVLIVEDNDAVADFLQITFRAYGYHTLLAANREQAVKHCQRGTNTIQALIADVRLGGSSGFETAQMLKKICPEMKVILISGYPYEHLVSVGLLPAELGTTRFLQKPFVSSEIIAAVRSLQGVSSKAPG